MIVVLGYIHHNKNHLKRWVRRPAFQVCGGLRNRFASWRSGDGGTLLGVLHRRAFAFLTLLLLLAPEF